MRAKFYVIQREGSKEVWSYLDEWTLCFEQARLFGVYDSALNYAQTLDAGGWTIEPVQVESLNW